MWSYEKRLQFPVNIKKPDPKAAQIIISQYGGPYVYRGNVFVKHILLYLFEELQTHPTSIVAYIPSIIIRDKTDRLFTAF